MPVRSLPRRRPSDDSPGSFRVEPLTDRTVPSGNPMVVSDPDATATITAAADHYATAENKALTIAAPGVLANDTDPNGEPLTPAVASGPAHGTLTLQPDGSFHYVPDRGFFGTDTFTYLAEGPAGDPSEPATVTIEVTRVDHRPDAKSDRYTIPQDTALKVPATGVLANDTDPDGDRLSAVLVTGPEHGTLTLRANGSFRYIPDAGFTGTDSFTYRASDGSLTSHVVRVTIKVVPAGPKTTPDPPPVPPSSGGGSGPGSGGSSRTPGGPTPTSPDEVLLPAPPALTGSLAVFGSPGPVAYVSPPPAPPAAVTPGGTVPGVIVPSLPPSPTVPYILPPVPVEALPSPVFLPPIPVVPDLPAVPPIPQLQADNPVFGGLDELSHDVGQARAVTAVTGTVVGTGVVATAGYVLLSPRLAYWLLSALLARRTVWKPFDPLEVVYAWEREKGLGGDDDSLEKMVDSDNAEPKA